MILYFSGTGNSKYVAHRLADALDDTLLSINERIRVGDTSPVRSDGRLIIVAPTYAWRIPRIVQDWLMKTEFVGAAKAWFLMTCGSEIGNAAVYNRALCSKKGLSCMGTAEIIMPENHIVMFNAPDAAQAREIVARAEPSIDRAAACIAADRTFPLPRARFYERIMSGPVNPAFYALFVKTKAFTAGESCISCGRCAALCPLNNISLRDGRPVWGKNCTHCLACICYCPTEAIEYGKKSLGKPRYHLEALGLQEGTP